ncbi:MAG: hypothetical protein IID44_19300 [Planctomycetes bacterium]|nr:hypothetical protein [Planctomycetota bacterium]
MPSIPLDLSVFQRAALLAIACWLGPALLSTAWAQGAGSGTRDSARREFPENRTAGRIPNRTPSLNLSGAAPGGFAGDVPIAETVVGVRIEGNKKISPRRIEPYVKTRPGKPFNLDTIKADVRRLLGTRLFVDVQTFRQQVRGGVVVVFRVVERPVLQYVKYIGNHKIKRKHLVRESGLKPGDPLDPYAVSEARRKIEAYYEREGFSEVRVEIIEGNERTDRGAVFLINETKPRKIWSVDFIGNTIASDGRLATQIRSKPPLTRAIYLLPFNMKSGVFNRKVLDDDVKRLTVYYRNLGFFNARVGREIHFDEGSNFVNVTFVIDEGPRFKVRNVSVIGNAKIGTEEITEVLQIKPGDHFNQASMNSDVKRIVAVYGSNGYIYSDIQPAIRYPDNRPGELDLVYKINEGQRYRVGPINVHIGGDSPHTRITTVLNRLHLRTGDVADQRKVEASMVDLKRSALFARDGQQGGRGPRSAFRPPEEAIQKRIVDRRRTGSSNRFQSPDNAARHTAQPGNPYWNIRTDGRSRLPSQNSEWPGSYQRTELPTGRIR